MAAKTISVNSSGASAFKAIAKSRANISRWQKKAKRNGKNTAASSGRAQLKITWRKAM